MKGRQKIRSVFRLLRMKTRTALGKLSQRQRLYVALGMVVLMFLLNILSFRAPSNRDNPPQRSIEYIKLYNNDDDQ